MGAGLGEERKELKTSRTCPRGPEAWKPERVLAEEGRAGASVGERLQGAGGGGGGRKAIRQLLEQLRQERRAV